MPQLPIRYFLAAAVIGCLLPGLSVAQAGDPPLSISSLDQVVTIDRLIAERAYRNLKAGRAADHGMDFARLDDEIDRLRPELAKFDPAFLDALEESYERMKASVGNPNSNFVRAAKRELEGVESKGRSPSAQVQNTKPGNAKPRW